MCGITGVISLNTSIEDKEIRKMVMSLKHRGPDAQKYLNFVSRNVSIALGHSRLAIIDLSNVAEQPMIDNENIIVFNGEIYNFEEIRNRLVSLNYKFKTKSDTEVILYAYREWGEEAVNMFIGMFAIAIFDRTKEELILFRDRVGVKPLYYYYDGLNFIFGSELKAIYNSEKFKKELSIEGVQQFFKWGYIPAPFSIYKNTYKLKPGHKLKFKIEGNVVEIDKYWSAIDYAKVPKMNIKYDQAKGEIKDLLKSAYEYRMVSDVPVGVFLSGGYDSTSVASILQKDKTNKIKTFTIGFEEGNNEALFAKETAKYLGTDHTEYTCKFSDAKELITDLPYYYDEPFGDSSAIPTMLVSKLAKRDVTVALSADGGDELFGGYNRYRSYMNNINFLNKKPFLTTSVFSNLFKASSLLLNDEKILRKKVDTLAKINNISSSKRYSYLYENSLSLSPAIYKNLFNDFKYPTNSFEFEIDNYNKSPLDVALTIDYLNYLPDDILTKVDRATMAFSLEGREPLLDHRLYEYVSRLPDHFKYSDGVLKKIFKDIVHDFVPKEMIDRPKTGFSLPISDWLRTDLKDYIEEFLCEKEIKRVGFFNTNYVNKLVTLFLKNKLNNDSVIWRLLQFMMWYKKWM